MINIATILKEFKVSTKLYSPVYGDVTFNKIDNYDSDNNIYVYCKNGEIMRTDKYGRMSDSGECLLFPSKEMQDWDKFKWKKGDVLRRNKDFCIFKGWEQDTKGYDYSLCFCVYYKKHPEGYDDFIRQLRTNEWVIASKNDSKTFIAEIESYYNGRLNLDTLEIEKQPEFKPKDWCLMRYNNTAEWTLCQYSHRSKNYFYSVGGFCYKHCIFYEGNEYLLGTADKPKVGEE